MHHRTIKINVRSRRKCQWKCWVLSSVQFPGGNLGRLTNTNPDIFQMWFSRWARHGKRVGCLQRQVSPHPRASRGSALQGVDLSQPEEAVVGEGRWGQEPQDEGVPGLHALRHSGYAEPCQRSDAPPGALLCAAVSGLLAFGLSPHPQIKYVDAIVSVRNEPSVK